MEKIFWSVFLVAIYLQQASLQNANSSGRRRQTGGVGCEAVLASYSQTRIPLARGLKTGTFYQITMKYPKVNNQGWVSWASRRDRSGANLAFVDHHNSHRLYNQNGGAWYHDTFWAFLTTTTPGWYHLVNCGYPQKYLTWSMNATLTSPADKYGYPLIIDDRYPGIRSPDDFLFKPVYVPVEKSYMLLQKSLGIDSMGVVSESASNYDPESYWLKVVPSREFYDAGLESDKPMAKATASFFVIDKPMNEIVP